MPPRIHVLLIASLAVLLGVMNAPALQDVTLGTIRDNRPFYEIPIVVTQDNSTIEIEMVRINGTLDPMLYLVDAAGNIVDENDDRAPGDLNSFIRFLQAPAGEYTVIATRFGVTAGDTSGDFRLEYQVLPPPVEQESAPTLYDVSPSALATAGYPPIEPRPRAEWTILAYYGASNDLEASVMNDLVQFEVGGGSTDDVRVVAFLDRSPRYSTANDNWSTARVFEVGPDQTGDFGQTDVATIDTPPLADLGRVNSAEGQTLAKFLTWAMQSYPAERYALAFASHGAGWRGVIVDDAVRHTLMPVRELERALQTASEATGVETLDLLINDACSMGSLEYYNAVAPFFHVTYASPEIVVNPALDMARLIRMLNADPDIALDELGAALIDQYIDVDTLTRRGADRVFLTHSAIDLNAIDPITEAVSAFVDVFLSDPARYSTAIGQARTNTYAYSAFIGDGSTVDLGHFMQQVIANSTDAALVRTARDVLTGIEAAVLYGRASPRVEPMVTHYSVYFPQNSRDFRPDYMEATTLPSWGRFLRAYYNAITPRLWVVEDSLVSYHPPIAPDVTVTRVFPSVSSTAFPPTISVEVVGRRIASGALTIDEVMLDGRRYRLAETPILTEVPTDEGAALVNSWKSGVDQAVFNWLPPELPVITDGTTTDVAFLRRVGDTASLEGRVRLNGGDEWTDVSLIFDLEGELQSVISRGRSSAGAITGTSLADIDIAPGTEFQAYRYLVTEDGQLLAEPGTAFIWPRGGLTWRNEPARNGTYDLGFLVRAFGGASGFDSVRIEVDNTDYDDSLLGYADINLGINFQRPVGWSEVLDQGNWLTSSSPSGDATLNVYYFRALDNIFQIKSEVQRRFGIRQDGWSEYYIDGDTVGLRFNYNYLLDDGSTWSGVAVAFYRQTAQGGRGLIFALDARDGGENAARLDSLFDEFVQSITFFDAQRLAQLDVGEWRYDFLTQRVFFPVRRGWTATTSPDGSRTLYLPPMRSARQLAEITVQRGNDASAALDAALIEHDIDPQAATRRLYSGEYHNWQTAQYTVTRDSLRVIGRIYVTEINNQLYIWRFETLNSANAANVFRETFEFMLDGFAPPVTASYAGNRNAFVKSALVSANDICGAMLWDTVCYVGREDAVLRAIALQDGQPVLREIEGTESLEDIIALQVGVLPDGSFDPFSVAVLNIQANLPDSNTSEDVKLVVFGGATVVNLSPPQTTLIMQTQPDITAERINMRERPLSDAFINGAIAVGEPVRVVGRTADGDWLRVQVPRDPSRTGWVPRTFLLPFGYNPQVLTNADFNAWQQLPVSDPAQPYFTNMQSIEVSFAESDRDSLNGLLIQTSPSRISINVAINGALFEVAGGSLFFWRGSFNDLEAVSDTEQADVFDDTIARRRPSGWQSEVISGTVQIRLAPSGEAIQQPTAITGTAGTAVSFDSALDDLVLGGSALSGGSLGAVLAEAFENLVPEIDLTVQD
ncbi:MAG: hypothetical protein EA396_04855 [Anaerolineaceae bacterium]|nr:MAG: hypothetical protein EA396_04855 [Anaerolineaceae bacterium]